MNVSELIKELQAIQNQHGDINVKVDSHNHFGDSTKNVSVIQTFTDVDKSKFVYVR